MVSVRHKSCVGCLYSGLAGASTFVARVALLACVDGLAFIVCVLNVCVTK